MFIAFSTKIAALIRLGATRRAWNATKAAALFGMDQPPQSVLPLARPLIAQCRADIAAAWEQLEAGRRILENSRWLLQRWAEQARLPIRAAVVAPHRPMGGDFVTVEETPRQRLKFKRRLRSHVMKPTRIPAADHRPSARAS